MQSYLNVEANLNKFTLGHVFFSITVLNLIDTQLSFSGSTVWQNFCFM